MRHVRRRRGAKSLVFLALAAPAFHVPCSGGRAPPRHRLDLFKDQVLGAPAGSAGHRRGVVPLCRKSDGRGPLVPSRRLCKQILGCHGPDPRSTEKVKRMTCFPGLEKPRATDGIHRQSIDKLIMHKTRRQKQAIRHARVRGAYLGRNDVEDMSTSFRPPRGCGGQAAPRPAAGPGLAAP